MNAKKPPVVMALLSFVLICLYPCLFQYTSNAPESKLVDAAIFFGIFLAIGLLGFLILFLLLRNIGAAGFLTDIGMLIFMNIGLINSSLVGLFPWMRVRYLLVVLAVPLAALFFLFLKKKYRCDIPCLLVNLMFGAASFVTLLGGAPDMIDEIKQNSARENLGQQEVITASGQHPNVYYFIYDEYAGPACLEYYYKYNNDPFYEQLTERGFNCSQSSYNPESCATVILVPVLHNLGYDIPPYFNSNDNIPTRLTQTYLDLGYNVNVISQEEFLDSDGGTELTQRQSSDSIARYLYTNSLLPSTPLCGPLESLPQLWALHGNEKMLYEVQELFVDSWQYTEEGPTLTLGYIGMPHTNFYYDKDGAPVSREHWMNWKDPQYYLGFLEYTNGQILRTVDEIISHDPGAIVILQSDHGARTGYHLEELYGGPYDPEAETIYQQNILNCVYWGGRQLDIEGLTGVNTLRLILNETYGMELEMLPVPSGFVNVYP